MDFWGAVTSAGIWIGQHLPNGARQSYVNSLNRMANNLGSESSLLNSSNRTGQAQGICNADFTGVLCATALMQGAVLDPSDFWGASLEDADGLIPNMWRLGPSRGAGGCRWANGQRPGGQVRWMPGNPNDPNELKQGPYFRVSEDGTTSGPIPAAGNPYDVGIGEP